MRVFLTGGSGLIGTELIKRLRDRGDQVILLTRNAKKLVDRPEYRAVEIVEGNPTEPGPWKSAIDGVDGVINLVGQNVFGKRWKPEIKRAIRDSRVHSTDQIADAIVKATQRPEVLVQASAVGYYGPTEDQELSEDSPSGTDFMAVLCREWEQASERVQQYGTRRVIIRVGVVLAHDGGALNVMTPIFRWVPGGAAPVGNGGRFLFPATGQQWFSWIHLHDIVELFLLGLDNRNASGPINGTAPGPVRNAEFSKALARVLHRPFLPFGPPDTLLRVILGEVAQVVTRGQRVLPRAAEALGYRFRFPELNDALTEIFDRTERPRLEGDTSETSTPAQRV